MATDKPITGFDPLDVADVESDDILIVVDVHDTAQSSSGSTKTLTLAALLGSIVDLTMSGVLTMTRALSKIVPGATSFSIRNHADDADNLLVADDGSVTVRKTLTATSTVQGGRIAGNVATPPTVTGLATGVSSATLATGGDNSQGVVTVVVDSAGGTIASNTSLFTVNFDGGVGAYTQIPSVLAGPSNLGHAGSIGQTGFHLVTDAAISRLGGTFTFYYQAMGI